MRMMAMEYISEAWRRTLRQNHADSFAALWRLQQNDWFEEPNYRRGGWSGVCKTVLTLDDASQAPVFIKRQENHVYRSWRHFFRLRPTFEREYRNILLFNRYDIPTAGLLFYGQQQQQDRQQALLMLQALEGYRPLGDAQTLITADMDRATRRRLFDSVAAAMRRMHAHRFQHSCPYPKHIFIKQQSDGSFVTRFIDLEKARRRWSGKQAAMKDLGILHRHTSGCSRTDRLRFFLAYRQETRLSPESKKMLAVIARPKKSRASAEVSLHSGRPVNSIREAR